MIQLPLCDKIWLKALDDRYTPLMIIIAREFIEFFSQPTMPPANITFHSYSSSSFLSTLYYGTSVYEWTVCIRAWQCGTNVKNIAFKGNEVEYLRIPSNGILIKIPIFQAVAQIRVLKDSSSDSVRSLSFFFFSLLKCYRIFLNIYFDRWKL